MTNRDTMVGMPLEEQILYVKYHLNWICFYCPYEMGNGICDIDECEQGITNWLNAEAGDDERRWLEMYFEVNDYGTQI